MDDGLLQFSGAYCKLFLQSLRNMANGFTVQVFDIKLNFWLHIGMFTDR